MTFDEDSTRLMGIPVDKLGIGFNILVAVSITLSIKIIGIILVVALLVLPGLTALQLNLSFKGSTVAAIIFGITSVLVGIVLSALYDVASSGVIVFTAAGIFIVAAAYKKVG